MKKCVTRLHSLGLCSAVAAVIGFGPGAFGQGTTPDGKANDTTGDGTEILVTATKRSESVLKVPISITAFSQDNLNARGVRDIRDIIGQTPGLDISRSSGAGATQNRIIIRGIDSTAGAATSAVYIDDTPIQARNSSLNYNGTTIPYIFDLDRVEVLRGPQGTLFGASSEGGAIRFVTPTPSLTKTTAYARAGVSAVQDGGMGYEAGLALGGPIVTDKLGIRASFYTRKDAGWIDRQSWENPADVTRNVNSSTTYVGRIALRWAPTGWLELSPSLTYQNLAYNDRVSLWTRCPATTNAPVNPTLNPCPSGVSDPVHGKYISYSPLRQPSHDRFFLPSFKASADLGFGKLTSVTSWFDRKVTDVTDATYINPRIYFGNAYLFPMAPGVANTLGYQNPTNRQYLFTQEVRLSGGAPEDRVRYTAGIYYSRGRTHSDVPINLANYPQLNLARFGSLPTGTMIGDAIYYGIEDTIEKEIAAFANVDITLADRLTLTLAGRYSRDTLDFNVFERGVSYPAAGSRVIGRQKGNPFLPKANLAFQATPGSLYYATYSQGYRTGGVNKTLPSTCTAEAGQLGLNDTATFQPDRTASYEVGTKNRIAGGMLQYELSGYVVKWKNIQQQLRLNCAFSLIANTASATSAGFDANITLRPTSHVTLTALVGYVDATYDKTIATGTAPIVLAGQTLGATPWTINLSGEYRFDLGSHDSFIRAQYNFKSANKGRYLYQFATATTYDPTRTYPDAVSTVDLRAGTQVGSFGLALYAQNLFNNVSYNSNVPTYAAGPLWFGDTVRPRLVGVEISARY